MDSTVRNRVALLTLAVILLGAAIGARLYQLQILRADELRAQARQQHERTVEISSRRGAIVDRQGRELAVSIAASSLFVHPHKVDDPNQAASLLSQVLDVPRGRILKALRSTKSFVWLRRRLDIQTANAVRRLDLDVGRGKPFGFETEAKRNYPQGSLAAHIVGFANIDQKGIEGIELVYDDSLRGDSSGYLAVRDGRGGTVLQLVQPPSREPEDIVLSLDLVLQHIAERELRLAIRRTGARWGSVVLVDPASGQILAMANRPNADPNHFGDARPSARRNRAVTDTYEPGSTFKIVTAAAALDSGSVRPNRLFRCDEGCITIAGKRIGDSRPHGWVTLKKILHQSCNPGIVQVAQTMPRKTFYEYIRRFGFGGRTGIELPGEARGILAPPERWSALSPASLAFGQEIAVTPLQMTMAFAAIANEGMLAPPRVVLGTRDSEGRFRPAPAEEPRPVVSSHTARTLAGMLEGVVARGTGKGAAVPGYRIAGKTGTAQVALKQGGYSKDRYVASFGGFGPVRSPRLAGMVVLGSPRSKAHSGGEIAAPVFGRIMAESLAYLRVPPDEDPLAALSRPDPDAARSTRGSVRGATSPQAVVAGGRRKG